MAGKRNFLVLMADQLTARALRAYGGVAKTPNIDALAARSALFEHCYCNSPLCAPSRFSFMAGQLPSRIGAYDNAAEFAAQTPTFAHYLRRLGYQTALAGKMHFCGPDGLHGFEERLTTDIYPADFGWTPDWLDPATRPPWYHVMDSVTQAGPCVRTNQVDFDDEVVYASRQKLFDIARSNDSRPFCLVVSMTHPHDPYTIPTDYWNRYRDDEVPAPQVGAGDVADDPHSARVRHVIGLGLKTPTAAQVQAARRAYLGAISYVDDQVGLLLKTLRESGLEGNTVVLLLADHGDMLGERGMWFKMSFFEPACHIPLMVSVPGTTGRRVAQPVSLLDVLPTLLDLAAPGRAPEPAAPLDGESLAPLLAGGAMPADRTITGEYLGEGAIAPVVMLRQGRWKFIHCPVDPDQLYDLEADPQERRNLAGEASAAATVAAFRAEVARRWNLDAVHADVLASQKRRHMVYASLREGRNTPWDYQPMRDASRLYVRNDQELNDIEAMARFPPAPRA